MWNERRRKRTKGDVGKRVRRFGARLEVQKLEKGGGIIKKKL